MGLGQEADNLKKEIDKDIVEKYKEYEREKENDYPKDPFGG